MPKRTAKYLTAADVNNAKPRAKSYELRDAGQKGLLLRVMPSGVRSWMVVYTVGGRKTRKTLGDGGTMTLARARTLAKKTGAAAEEGHDLHAEEKRAKGALLGKYIDGPYTEYATRNILSYKDILARLKRNFDHLYKRSMAEITELDIQRWRKKKGKEKRPVSFETLQRELTYLKACLNTAIREHKAITSHQLASYRLQRDTAQMTTASGTAPRFLSKAEEKALRAALDAREQEMREARESMRAWERERGKPPHPEIKPDQFADHIKPIVLLALNTGLRRGDLFSLEWRHVDLNQKQIRKVINKTRRKNIGMTDAVLPLTPEAVRILTTWKKQTSEEGLLFPSPVTGKMLVNIDKAWRGIMKQSEIKGFRFHDLRHSYASQLVMGGMPLNTVRELMTHADPKMTLVYAHLSPDHKAEELERIFGK